LQRLGTAKLLDDLDSFPSEDIDTEKMDTEKMGTENMDPEKINPRKFFPEKFPPEQMARSVMDLMTSPSERRQLSPRSRALVDGKGSARVVDALIGELSILS
jgi:hypothetical protein